MKRYQFQDIVKKQVVNHDVLSSFGQRIELVKSGGRYMALCPFHNEQTLGAFQIGGAKNIAYCYKCGESFDVIELYRKLDGTSFPRALMDAAIDLKYITKEQATELLTCKPGGEWEGGDASTENTVEFIPHEDNSGLLADPDTLDKVLSVFAEGMTLLGQPLLTKEHKSYLMHNRKLSEEEIESAGFFTFPSILSIKAVYERLYTLYGFFPEVLEGIPGFYSVPKWKVSTEKSKYIFAKEMPEITAELFVEMDGIAIPMRDAKGRIRGIQVRSMKKKVYGSRYVWFSSASASQHPDKANGISSGSPKDVTYPTTLRNKTLFITEGKFKSLEIAKTFGSVSISIQGVSSWRGIEELIEEVEEEAGITFNHVVLAYDADMAVNPTVVKHTLALGQAVKETGKSVYVAGWDMDLGKGIDDLIKAGYKSTLVRTEYEEFKRVMTKVAKANSKPEKRKELFIHYKIHILKDQKVK